MQVTAQILELDRQRSQVVTKIKLLLNNHDESEAKAIDLLYEKLDEIEAEMSSCCQEYHSC